MDPDFRKKTQNSKVFVRILPTENQIWDNVKILNDKKTLYVRCLQDFLKAMTSEKYWSFATDGIFYNSYQDEVYDTVMNEVLEGTLRGNSAIIIAFGQTGSGKSLTINGLDYSFAYRGLAPRIITQLFRFKNKMKQDGDITLNISCLEITRSYMVDLFDLRGSKIYNLNKQITSLLMKNEEHGLKLLFQAEGRREIHTDSPYRSHKATGITTIHIKYKSLLKSNPIDITSKIHLIDLAGADIYGKETSLWKNTWDLGNLVKSQMEQFILILKTNEPDKIHTNRRLCMLVQYLGPEFCTHSILRFIAHVRTNKDNLLITLSMMRLCQIIRGLKPDKLSLGISMSYELSCKLLQEELASLKKQIQLESMLNDRDLAFNISQSRIQQMQDAIKEFLQNKTNDLALLNVSETRAAIKIFKDMYNKIEADKDSIGRIMYEKAYQDVVANLKNLQSTSAQSLHSFGSAKGKKGKAHYRSKESMQSRDSFYRDDSSVNRSMASPESVGKTDKSGVSLGKSNLPYVEGPVVRSVKISKMDGQRKSSESADRAASMVSMPDDVIVPNFMPTEEEAWNAYINDEKYNYKDFTQQLEQFEETAKATQSKYLHEVGKLQKYMNVVEIKKTELHKAQLQRHHFVEEEYDENGQIITSKNEKLLLANLKRAEIILMEQQEYILKLQTDLRLSIDGYHTIKENITRQFNIYCNEKFKTPLPNAQKIASIEDKLLLPPQETSESKLIAENETEEDAANKYEQLKRMMIKESNKKINEVKKEWVKYF